MTEPGIRLDLSLARDGFSLAVATEFPVRGITGILGASGSGKTTLLHCIAGLEPDCRGVVNVLGAVWQDAHTFLPPHRRAVGYIFQDARLFPHLSVRDNLAYGQKRSPAGSLTFEHVVELLEIGALLDRKPARLSGGERQRAAIGRALLRNPALVLMDEPLASLDARRKQEILPFLDRLHRELTTPIVYVSHSVDEVSRLCDHLLVLEAGRIEASGSVQEVLSRPDLSLPVGEEAGAILNGTVAEYVPAYELTRVTTAAGDLLLPGECGPVGTPLRLRVLARDVSLTLEPSGGTTILNSLPVTIDSLHPRDGGYVDVRVCAGTEPLLARISRKSSDQLGLRPGLTCHAQLKGVAVKNRTSAVRHFNGHFNGDAPL